MYLGKTPSRRKIKPHGLPTPRDKALQKGPQTLNAPNGNQLELLKWVSRLYARGLGYTERLSDGGSRRPGEAVEQTLRRAPLTPRERDVVSFLVGGSSTRHIASETRLTVSTVNTYLKRIFSKLGVHSRVELIARMAGTATIPPRPNHDGTLAD